MRHRAHTVATTPSPRGGSFSRTPVSNVPSSALRRLVVQAQLTVGSVADPAEREAERIADQIVGSLGRPAAGAQRVADGEDPAVSRAHVTVRRQVPEEDEELMASRTPAAPSAVGPEGGPLDDTTATAISGARGSGDPLTDGVRRSMESAFGADLSGVRVHTDSRAHDLNGALQSRAFTVGTDIFFRRGDYQPESTHGQKLLAHELTHVVQQGRPR